MQVLQPSALYAGELADALARCARSRRSKSLGIGDLGYVVSLCFRRFVGFPERRECRFKRGADYDCVLIL